MTTNEPQTGTPEPQDDLPTTDLPLVRPPDPIEQAEHENDQALGIEWAMRLMSP